MSRINRYILQQLLVLFGFFALVLVLIYWINRAVRLFDQLIADGQSGWVFLEFTALTIPSLLTLVVPIAAFAAAVYQFNRLSSDSELSILKATGHSGFRLIRPFLAFGVLVCMMQFALQHFLVPTSQSTLKVRTVQTAENATARLLQEGTFINASSDITLFIKEVSPEGELINVFMHDASNEQATTYFAVRAYLVRSDTGPKLVMIDGTIQAQTDPAGTLTTTRYNDFVIDLSQILSVGPVAPQQPSDLNSWDLLQSTAFNSFDQNVQVARRLLATFLPLVTVLVGTATVLCAGFSRFGIWNHVVYAFLLLIFVNLLEGVSINYVRSERGHLWAMSAPIVTGLVIAITLLFWRDKPWRKAPFLGDTP